MSNIHGLHSNNRNDSKAKKDEEEFNQGGKTSSTAVIRPNGKGNDSISDLLAQSRGNQPGAPGQTMKACIILYANGFKIGEEGEFRDISDPNNALLVKEIKEGNVPTELQEELRKEFADGDTLGVNLVDKSSETFYPPPPKFDFNASQGNSLGSSSSSAIDLTSLTPAEYALNENDPKTTLQVVLHNRKKVRCVFNHSATVGQLYQHVMHISGNTDGNFVLLEGYPPKPLKDTAPTLKEAGLVGTSVQQKLN